MSNEQKMVSVPSEPTNGQKVAGCKAYMEADGSTQAMNPTAMGHAYRAMLSGAAVDHQGEPVKLPSCNAKFGTSPDWDQGYTDGWNACLDEIAKLGPLYTHAAPAAKASEPAAWYKPHWRGHSAEWRLGAQLTDAVFPEMWKPLLLHPDSGEVERLRAELKTQTLRADAAVGDANEAERNLAEALARAELVRDAVPGLKRQRLSELLDHLFRASASAEPEVKP